MPSKSATAETRTATTPDEIAEMLQARLERSYACVEKLTARYVDACATLDMFVARNVSPERVAAAEMMVLAIEDEISWAVDAVNDNNADLETALKEIP